MIKLEAKSRLFYEVAEHKYALSRILELLEEVSDMKSRELDKESRDSHSSQTQDGALAMSNGQQTNSSKTIDHDTSTASKAVFQDLATINRQRPTVNEGYACAM